MTRYGFGDSDAQQLSTQFVNAAATAQKHVRWVACTESSCCEGGRDVSMRGECKCDAGGIRSTEPGRVRVVFDARATIQRHVRWVACTGSSYCEGGRNEYMRGECRRGVDIMRSTEAGRGRGVFDARATIQRHVRWVAHRQQLSAQTAAMPRAGAMGECVAIAGVMWTSRAAPAQVEIASFPMPQRWFRGRCAG